MQQVVSILDYGQGTFRPEIIIYYNINCLWHELPCNNYYVYTLSPTVSNPCTVGLSSNRLIT